MTAQTQMVVVFVTYLVFLVVWGLYQGRRVRSGLDFAIAGRRLPGWVAALSERATGESSWALLGLPGFAYAQGLVSIWTAVGCVAGIVVAWALLSWRLRAEAELYQVRTFTDYVARRHSPLQGAIRCVASLTIVFFFFFYVGAQFLGGGKVLNTLFGLDQRWGMLLTALIIAPYCVYGGFRSVVYTDVVQALIMIATLLVGPAVGLVAIAGRGDVYARSVPEALARAGGGLESLTGAMGGLAAGIAVMGGLSWFFGYLGGQPQLTLRFMAIRDAAQARRARWIGLAWTILAYAGALSIGWIGLALFGPNQLPDPEHVMPAVLRALLPPPLAALLIVGAVAAMISTADSLLLVASTELAENLLQPLQARAPQSEAKRLMHARVITGLLAAIALAVAYVSPSRLIYSLVGYVWAGIGGTFSVVILGTLFSRRFHARAALITIVVGVVFTVVWIRTGLEEVITARVMTFVVAGIAAALSSVLIPAPENQAPC
ncbi:MAG: sodium/proline symporter [candidate division KSB1 bacterium]|nr:sodium/proline symporter [candidate division KSB1 bacterium]MDZ7393786.1 sodium/proline symporter [candidate division KSB1 bacterium]